MKVSVGPVTAAEFDVTVALKDKAPPNALHHADRRQGRRRLQREASASVDLADAPGGETVMTYSSDVQVGGRIAAVGQRLIESVAKMMTRQALDALNAELRARAEEPAR